MKLSELPLRDYIAIENVGRFAMLLDPDDAAASAYLVADAMLARMGRHEHEHRELIARANKAEASVSVLLNMNEDGQFAPRVALSDIWEFLGVKNQTDAMQMIRRAFPELCDDRA